MGQCCGCPHNGQPRQLSMKAKKCAASKHCFVINHCLSESPVTTFGWWCVVVCARGLSLSLSDRQRQTDRDRQTETDRDRQKQTETDRETERQADTYRNSSPPPPTKCCDWAF